MENADVTATAVPGWEASKENVLPVKKGRSAKGLSERFARPVMGPSLEEEQEKAFEDSLRNTTAPEERFEIYSKYLKWTRDTFPSTTEKSMLILERCTCEFKDNEEMKNEPKYVMMWIDYADMVRTPGDVFSFMQTNKIGERVALFWVAWAYVAEKALNYKLTDQIFQKGIRRNAEPKDLLSQRYKQFMRRMARLYLNNTVGTDGISYTESANSNAAVDNAIIQTAMEAIRAQPSVQSGSSNSASAGAQAVPGERRAMSTLMGHSNTTTTGPIGISNNNTTAANGSGASRSHTNSTRPSNSTTSRSTTNTNNPRAPSSNVGFEIFSDTPVVGNNNNNHSTSAAARSAIAPHLYEADKDGNHNNSSISGAPAATWKQLGSEAVRRKENDGPVTKWTAGPLFPAAAATSTFGPSSSSIPTTTSIPIFVDEQFQSTNNTTNPSTVTAVHSVPENVLSVRKQLDAVDVIAKNPLARHTATTTTAASGDKPTTVEAAKTLPKRAPLGESALVSAPVGVSADVKELPVFTSLPHPEVVVPTKVKRDVSATVANVKVQPAGGLPFTIFSDTTNANNVSPVKKSTLPSIQSAAFTVYESPTQSNNKNTVSARSKTTAVNKTSAPAMGFAIYSDEPAAPTATINKAVANKGTNNTTKDNTGLSFAIYSDEPAVNATTTAKKPTSATTTAPSAGFTIFSDEPVPKKTAKPSAGFIIFSDEPVAKPSVVVASKGFSIYESPSTEPAAAVNKPSTNTVKPSTKPAFDIFVDESVVHDTAVPTTTNPASQSTINTVANADTLPITTTITSSTEEHDAELQQLLDNMVTLDAEDGTINTRLARRDIDMMFCSPTIHRAPAAATISKTSLKTSTKDCSVIYDENAAPFTLKSAPLAALRTPGPATAFTPYTAYKEEGSFDAYDNDYAEPIPYTSKNASVKERVVLYSDSNDAAEPHKVGSNNVLTQAQHRPFGTHLETFSAVKDLSAIKSNQEFSMCGMMDTPGHTNTLGFGHHGQTTRGFHNTHKYNNNNTNDKNHHLDRLLDFDISHSRESIGSVCANPTTAKKPLGFSIFEDSVVVEGEEEKGGHSLKRKGLSETGPASKPYTGLSADALPPSRRRMYNPFRGAVSTVSNNNSTAAVGTFVSATTQDGPRNKQAERAMKPTDHRRSSATNSTGTDKNGYSSGNYKNRDRSAHGIAMCDNTYGSGCKYGTYNDHVYTSDYSPMNDSNVVDYMCVEKDAADIVMDTVGHAATPSPSINSNISSSSDDIEKDGSIIHNSGGNDDILVPVSTTSSGAMDTALTPLVPQPMDSTATAPEHTHTDADIDDAYHTITTSTGTTAHTTTVYHTSPLDLLLDAVAIRSTVTSTLQPPNNPFDPSTDRVAKRIRRSDSLLSVQSIKDNTDYTSTSDVRNTNHTYIEPEVEVFNPETFHSLEPDTFNYIVEQLQLYYTHLVFHIAVVVKADTAHPTCFNFRTKVNTQEKYILPHVQYTINSDNSKGSGAGKGTSRVDNSGTKGVYKICNSIWSVVTNIGRGSYGHAILMQRTTITATNTIPSSTSTSDNSSMERAVYKVDTNRDSVLWEAFIHLQIQLRIQGHSTTTAPTNTTTTNSPITTSFLHTLYTTYILPPHTLYVYRTCTILGLPYLSFGTLVNALRVLMIRDAFSLAEHEYIVAYLSIQMVQALLCVHSVGILHCDVKTDNWLLERCVDNTDTPDTLSGVRVKLIDFGRSLSVAHSSSITLDKRSVATGLNTSEQLTTLTRLYHSVGSNPTDPAAATFAVPEIEYRGDISAKGYKCAEMEQSIPWSYQTDLHGLCSCIHQLLHLMPLTLYSDTSQQCTQRGLSIHTTMQLINQYSTLGSDNINSGGIGRSGYGDRSLLIRELESKEFVVPQATLKRYWNKPLWGGVYLTLLNAALFKPVLLTLRTADSTGDDINSSYNYSVILLQLLSKALLEHLSSVAKNTRESAVGKLVAKLTELEL